MLPEQPERDPGRRARGRAVREARARGAHHGARRRASPRCWPSTRTRAPRRTPRPWAARPTSLRVGGVAPAARDDARGRFAAGEAVGYAGGELVAWGDPERTLAATLERLAGGSELVTCLAGDGRSARPRVGRGARARRGGGRVPRGRPTRLVVAALRGVTGFASHGRAHRRRDPAPRRCGRTPVPSALRGARGADRAPRARRSRASGSRPTATWSSTCRTRTATAATCAAVADLLLGEEATVAVVVRSVSVRPMRDRRRKRVEARRRTRAGRSLAVWFNQPWIARQLGEGTRCSSTAGCGGAASSGSPSTSRSAGGDAPVHTVGLVPVHPATEGLSAGAPALARLGRARALPAHARAAARAPARGRGGWRSARRRSPAPTSPTARTTSAARGAGSRSRSCCCSSSRWPAAGARAGRAAAPARSPPAAWWWTAGAGRSPSSSPATRSARWRRSTRTSARERPMQRLLMGEVGAGKTVVALHAMLRAVENGAQAALMAPTETLAEQHHRTLDRLLGGAHAARAAHGLDSGRPAARPARRARLGRAPAAWWARTR